MKTIKDGYWFFDSVWDTGKAPTETDEITVMHTVTSTSNIVIKGKLIMRPGGVIKFTDINESKFIGGGMDVMASDVGLWVMETGTLDLQGTKKTSWTNAKDSLQAGATVIDVESASGWNVGDEIVISPTDKPNVVGYLDGEERTIASIVGNLVVLNKPLSKAHLAVSFNGQTRTAEVMNLTRDVRIEGTSGGNSHIFIHAAVKQSVSYAQMRFMGPRKDTGGGPEKEFVPGRYGLHCHHMGEGSRGSVVEGCVVRDTNSHAYVPHASFGITFRDNVAFNTMEAPFWVDEGHPTHSITYDHNIAGKIGYIPRSMTFEDPTSPTFGTHGFLLGVGDDCKCINNVVWGQTGSEDDFGSYTWQANNEGVWLFLNNLAHNSMQGGWVWQNTTKNHLIEKFVAYNCGHGWLHGAYANSYTFKDCTFFNCDFRFQANSSDAGLHLINSYIDAGGLDYAIDSRFGRNPSTAPIQIRKTKLLGFKVAALIDTNGKEEDSPAWIPKTYDMIDCDFEGVPIVPAGETGERVRVQNQNGNGKAYEVLPGNVIRDILLFAPLKYGTGTGLLGQYFNDSNFQTKVFERVDAPIAFQEWSNKPDEKPDYRWIDFRITGNNHSMRWTGQIEPQYNEAYTIILDHAGSAKMWLNGALTNTINATAGQRYDIKIEYSNNDDSSGVNLSWKSKSQVQMYIPGSQMYPSAGGVVIPPDIKPGVLTLTATPNSQIVRRGWRIMASSSKGGSITSTITNSQGQVKTTRIINSGDTVTLGSGYPVGNYQLKAMQGNVIKIMQISKK